MLEEYPWFCNEGEEKEKLDENVRRGKTIQRKCEQEIESNLKQGERGRF